MYDLFYVNIPKLPLSYIIFYVRSKLLTQTCHQYIHHTCYHEKALSLNKYCCLKDIPRQQISARYILICEKRFFFLPLFFTQFLKHLKKLSIQNTKKQVLKELIKAMANGVITCMCSFNGYTADLDPRHAYSRAPLMFFLNANRQFQRMLNDNDIRKPWCGIMHGTREQRSNAT